MPNSCTVCMNNSGKNKDISFFSYPRNHVQRQEWLQVVGRQDLIGKLEDVKARRNYRICERHFETNCIKFSKHKTVKYLTDNAYPTLNLPSSADDASTSTSQMYENISATTSSSQYEGTTAINNQNSENVPLVVDTRKQIAILSDQTSCSVHADLPDFENKMDECESRSSRTALHLSADTSRKRKLSLELREAKVTKTVDLNSITKNDFLKLCDKFLSKNMVQLVKWQIDLKMGYSDNRRDAWLKAVDREDLLAKFDDNKVRQNVYRICGDHFEGNCIKYSKNGNVKYLKDDAFPTLNLPSNASAASSCQREDVSKQRDETTEEVPVFEMSESRQQEWMQRIEHEDISMNETAENHRICSKHYPTSMFVNERFYPETVPIMHLPESSIKSEPCSTASSPTQCEVKLEIDQSAPYLFTMTVETQTDHIATDGMHLNMCDADPSTSKTVDSFNPEKRAKNRGVQTLKKHSFKLKERKLQHALKKSENKRKKLENDIKELVSNIDATESVGAIKKKLEIILKNATRKKEKQPA